MYTNVWLPLNGFKTPGEYPSGGAVPSMLSIWKAIAPKLSFLAPDIYQANHDIFTDICNKYARSDNPLFIPEMGKGKDFAREQFYAIAKYHSIGVGVYGVDSYGNDPSEKPNNKDLSHKLQINANNYSLFDNAINKFPYLQNLNKLKAVGEDYGINHQLVTMGGYDILFSFKAPSSGKERYLGRALIGQLDKNEFLIMGFNAKFQFHPKYGSGYSSSEYLTIEEGVYKNGKWIRKRIWNGDQVYFSTLTSSGNILRVRLRKVK